MLFMIICYSCNINNYGRKTMHLCDITKNLHAKVIFESSQFHSLDIEHVVVSDLMSDVLTTEYPSPLIVTSLSTDQTIRTASMTDAAGVVITGDKPLPRGIDKLARELDITLLHTELEKFDSCVLIGKLLHK